MARLDRRVASVIALVTSTACGASRERPTHDGSASAEHALEGAIGDIRLWTPREKVSSLTRYPQLDHMDRRSLEWYKRVPPGTVEGIALTDAEYGFAKGELVEIIYAAEIEECPELLKRLRRRFGEPKESTLPSTPQRATPMSLYDWVQPVATLHLGYLPKKQCGGFLTAAKFLD